MRIGIGRAGSWWGMAVGVALSVAGCGGGGGGGGNAGGSTAVNTDAPVVTDFRITALTPERANTQIRYRITATVTDPSGDLLGGHVEVNDGARTLTLTIDGSVLRGSTVTVVFITNPVPPGPYSGTFSVVDAAGNRSNTVAFTVTVNPQVPGAAETPAGGIRPPLLDGLEPGR
jgi:hypothetical protein